MGVVPTQDTHMDNATFRLATIAVRGRILRPVEAAKYVGMSRSSLYRLLAIKKFPAPTRMGIRAVGWTQNTLDEFIASRSTEVAE